MTCAVCRKEAKLHPLGGYMVCDQCEDIATTCYDDECDGLCYEGKRIPAMIESERERSEANS